MDGYNIHYGWFNHPKHIDGILRSLFFLDIGAFETSGFGCAMAKFWPMTTSWVVSFSWWGPPFMPIYDQDCVAIFKKQVPTHSDCCKMLQVQMLSVLICRDHGPLNRNRFWVHGGFLKLGISKSPRVNLYWNGNDLNDLGFPLSGNLHIILYHVSYYIHVYPKRLGIDQKRFLSVRTNGPWAWKNLRLSVGMLASLMRLQAGFRHGWSSVMTPFPKD